MNWVLVVLIILFLGLFIFPDLRKLWLMIFLFFLGVYVGNIKKEGFKEVKKSREVEISLSDLEKEPIDSIIYKTCLLFNFDPTLALAMADVESNKNPFSVGSKNEIGMFQIHVGYFKENLYNPVLNTIAYIFEMKYWLNKMGNLDLAIEAYNAGYKRNPVYLKKVKNKWNFYKNKLRSTK